MLSSSSFGNEKPMFSNDLHDEIYSQLFFLQIHCVKFLFNTIQDSSVKNDELIKILHLFVEVSPEIYNERGIDSSYVFQSCGQVLRLLGNRLSEIETSRLSRIVMSGLLSLRLISYLPQGSTIVADILSNLSSGGFGTLKIDLLDLREAFINQPYPTNTLIQLVNPSSPSKQLFKPCVTHILETFDTDPESCWKLLQLIDHSTSSTEYTIDSVKSILSFTRHKKCLRKHIIMAIGLCQSSEQLYQFSLLFRDQIMADIIHLYGPVPTDIVDVYEQLSYCLFVNGLPCLADDHDNLSQIGWLILMTNSRPIVSLLVNVIKTLIESRLLDPLTTLLKSPHLTEFNQLLLVNIWHQNLADEATMQTLLDLCYMCKPMEGQMNYIEQLCLKIRTRWDTLRRFNERLSSINKEQDTPTQLMLALTTTGNTSHLELVTGLLDPTGLDYKVVLDLLDRACTNDISSLSETTQGIMPLETDTIEENCDKNIFYCSVSIRKVWECLILFSPIETRQMLFKYLHQCNIMLDIDIVQPNMSFYVQLLTALQTNDLNLCHELYEQTIVSRLEYLQSHIDHINPLSLRLELLENLYSMLFLSENDLFGHMLTLNNSSLSNRPNWPLPETVKVIGLFPQDSNEEITPNFDKNRFVASFFLLKDMIIVIDKNIRVLQSMLTEMCNSPSSSFIDNKMAKTINYPSYEDIGTRIDNLLTMITDLQWRIGLLTVNGSDNSYNSIGIFDIPVCIMPDNGVGSLSESPTQKPNLRNRAKSSISTRQRTGKDRFSTLSEDKENAHPELLSSRIMQLGIIQGPGSFTQTIINHQLKDKFMLFQSPSLVDNADSYIVLSTDDCEQNLIKYHEHFRSSKVSRGNCLFLMNCLPHLMEPIDQLAITILKCGYRYKAEEIYEKYKSLKSDNRIFEELLSEIKYRHNFDILTGQLSVITTPELSTILEQSDNTDQLPLGQFNWRKLPAINVKLSLKKENEISDVLNKLETLDNRNRPTIKLNKQSDNPNKESSNNVIKHFNCGLLFDIAISGATTKWQLSKMIGLIESNYGKHDCNSVQDSMDLTKYHKMPDLIAIITQLMRVVTEDSTAGDWENYVSLEMGSYMDVEYSLFMKNWLLKLEASIHLLQLNETDDSVFLTRTTSNDDDDDDEGSKSHWDYLSNLISLIKETCVCVNKKEMPFRSLDRSIPLYLDSLCFHLKKFANFIGKYKRSSEKHRNQNSIVHQENEFSVLRLSPLQALGELIFLKSEDPLSHKMLQISDDLGLDISAVVLENCVPTISSSGSVFSSDVVDDDVVAVAVMDRRTIYNPSSEHVSEFAYNLDPIEIVTRCLNRIIKILLKNTYTTNQSDSTLEHDQAQISRQSFQRPMNIVSTFSVSSVTSADNSSSESSNKTNENAVKQLKPPITSTGKSSNIVFSSGWRVFLALSHDSDWPDLLETDIADLEHVNLDCLKTNNDRTAFFINLYNLMMIHLTVLMIEIGKTTLKYRSLESKLMRSNFCYKVGQIGVVSIEQISQYYLNIPDVTFIDLSLCVSEISSSLPSAMEQVYRGTCINCHNMAIFGMIDGTVSGQPLKVYVPDTIHKDLQNNLSYTIKYKTTYESEKRQIFLPQIFKWYSKLVCADNSEPRHNVILEGPKPTTSANADEILIQNILSKCNDKVARKFSLLFRLDTETMIHNIKEQSSNKLLKIIWQSRSESIGCSFIEKRQDHVCNIPKLNEYSSSAQSSLNSNISVICKPNFPPPNYQPTMEAINHLRDRSPLLACLAYLTIGDDFISIPTIKSELNVTDDTTMAKTRSVSLGQMDDKLREIRSYNYSRIIDEYPAVGHWIIAFWSEWLISRKSGQSSTINVSPANDTLLMYCCNSIPIEIRWAAFTHPLTPNLDQILIDYSLNVMSRDQHRYLNIGSALRMLQSQTMVNSYKLQYLLDIILEKSARYWANGLIINTNNRQHLPPDNTAADNDLLRLQEDRLLDCIYAMHDEQLRLRESTRYLELLNINNALTLMEFICKTLGTNATDDLKKQIVLLRIFKRIHDLVITCQNKYVILWKCHIPTEFLDWHRLQTLSEHDPNLVLKFLIKEKQFDLAKCWCRFYMPDDGEQKIEAEYLVSLVNSENDKEKIVEVVSHISRLHREYKADNVMRVIHHVIRHCEAPLAIILVCAYAIKNNLFNEFESVDGVAMPEWRDRIHRCWVGASMLRSITNEVTREQYCQLVQHPHLIMEQLIMNAEIEVFRKMMDLYKEQKKAYISIKRPQTANKLNRIPSIEYGSHDEFIPELEPERINVLLTEYIHKALELSAIRGDEDIDVENASLSSRVMSSRSSLAYIRPDITSSSSSDGTVVNTYTKPSNTSDTISIVDTFTIPVVPPPHHKWFKDSDAPKCMCCTKEKFSMFNRRHHCRRCGRVICSQCSTHRMSIDGVTVRICDDCQRSMNSQQDSNDRVRLASVSELLYSRHNLPQRSESIPSCHSVPTFDQLESSTTPVTLQNGVGALENGWRLGTDAVENEIIRQMFYYDDSPSVTIAFSLADFHSNSNLCGNVLLDTVEYLADFLKPMKNHLPNPEVDYLLVLEIAKQIAYKAKLKFSRLNNDMDFDRAENYLSRLDLLSVLVKSNFCNYLPSLSEGSKFIERIQSLRDKLIREERLELAGIVSSKAGLSNDPVFVAMGLHALDECKYDEARKLFASSSKIGRYGSQSSATLSYPVNEIMKILEGNKFPVQAAKEMVENINDSDDFLRTSDLKYREEREMSHKQITEAIYYLDIYNAPLYCLQFLCRQQMWSKAIDYVFKKNVSRDIFIEGLISPAVNSGNFAAVKSEIMMKEGGLASWKFYYESLCKFLDKKGCYDDLLEFQEKSGDHLQATRTLTNCFYLRGAQSYMQLRDRIGFLEKAQRHLEMYINKKENTPNFDLQKLKKNLILVKQQIEATIFLTDPITISHHQAKLGYQAQSTNPPTLFGAPEVILDLCLMILFCRPNLSDGLQMLCPLMAQCHIYAEKILPKAAVWLLQHPSAAADSETAGVTAVFELCTNIGSCYRLDTRKNDEVLVSILPVIPLSLLAKSNLVNRFIGLFKSESKKIDAFIVVKDLKRAYANAVRLGYTNDVQRILELAEAANDLSGVIDLCRQWLSNNKSTIVVPNRP